MKVHRFEPHLNAPCLCGSGLKFKRCCYGNHDGYGTAQQEATRKLLNERNFKGALVYARQSITIYTILHKTNTDPYIKSKNEGVLWLLEIDIKALSELVSTLFDCYRGLEDYEEFIDTTERLRGNINDSRWQRKITYFQILARLGNEWKDPVGKKEIKKLLPIDNEDDPEILQLCFHFLADRATFTRRLALIDRIISVIEKPAELLQYKVAKAVQYLLIGDDKEAISIAEVAIEEYEKGGWENDDIYGKHKRAESISLLADLKKSKKLKKDALSAYRELLLENGWSTDGLAHIYLELGKCYFHLGKFEKAIENYDLALDKKEDELTKVFMAQAYGEYELDKAIVMIQDIDESKIDSSGKLDMIFTYAALAVSKSNKKMIKNAVSMLKGASQLDPIFEVRKSELLSEISNCLAQGNCELKIGFVKNIANSIATFASRYLILQPNVAGLGININKIIDDSNITLKNKIQPTPKSDEAD